MTGVVPDFSLPCQHSLNHYFLMIRLFGAPNGLCSSITESKHIKAIKEPWRCSSRYKALGQMLLTNQHLDKIAAARSDFEACGMLQGSCVSDAFRELPDNDSDDNDDNELADMLQALPNHLRINERPNQSIEVDAAEIVDGPAAQAHMELAALPIPGGAHDVSALALELELPNFPTMIQQFLYDQLHVGDHEAPDFDPHHSMPPVTSVVLEACDMSTFVRRHHGEEVLLGMTVYCWDPDTGMHIVALLTNDDGTPDISLIHIDCIFRAAHLIPLYGADFLPHEITPHDSYNVFRAFYINKYADHHAFEVA
ncbi:uncharacterized protein F5891DRAFT_1191716 [Suillus fuscotomentosus]|uniref:Uncharacterized protein n=1 Tax=Suillus fuscotomentosus TaxID=1912939 RepID=A0AAD4E0R7_9AGAM|nr:uncharacterized protein F5891DRAFT_1191716 [Suillus fuscotomentosus]KAG1897517.1 hypothetical protein F5891DRAFT_1191716 [Suillus fuscotomentosus]